MISILFVDIILQDWLNRWIRDDIALSYCLTLYERKITPPYLSLPYNFQCQIYKFKSRQTGSRLALFISPAML